MIGTSEQLAALVDNAHAALIEARRTAETDRPRHKRANSVFLAAVMVYADGDEAYASGLADIIHDGGAPVAHVVSCWSRDAIIADGRLLLRP